MVEQSSTVPKPYLGLDLIDLWSSSFIISHSHSDVQVKEAGIGRPPILHPWHSKNRGGGGGWNRDRNGGGRRDWGQHRHHEGSGYRDRGDRGDRDRGHRD